MLSNNKTIDIKNDFINVKKPYKEKKIEDWILLYHFKHKRVIDEFCDRLLNSSQKCDIKIN